MGVRSGEAAEVDHVSAFVAMTRRHPSPPRCDAAPRFDLFDLADHLLVDVVAHRDRHYEHVLVDQREGAVLHLPRRVPLGVDVGDLLELQRPLESDRVVDVPPQEQEVATVVISLRESLVLGVDVLGEVPRPAPEAPRGLVGAGERSTSTVPRILPIPQQHVEPTS